MALSTADKEEIKDLIRVTVNGKIDKMNNRLDEHIERMDPVIDGLQWIESTRKFIMYIAAPIASLVGLYKLFD